MSVNVVGLVEFGQLVRVKLTSVVRREVSDAVWCCVVYAFNVLADVRSCD